MDSGWIIAIVSALTALSAALAWLFRHLIPLFRRVSRFLDDWTGALARPGVPARMGVMERLAGVEASTQQVLAETRPNGGASMRDVLHRTRTEVGEMRTELGDTRTEVSQMRSELGDVRSQLGDLTAWRATLERQVTTETTTIITRPEITTGGDHS